jgi:pyruvate dehydrogenase E1 component beta subunit
MAKKRIIQAINEALVEEMERDPKVILFGEDVEISLFGDTKGLLKRFGPSRIRNTPISENIIAGAAVGAAAAGYRVVCHMMYGNFVYTGMDAIANQAAKLRYMTGGQMKLPITFLAVMGGGRSGGAQHSDAVHPALMNLGGLKVVLPTTPADAKGLLKSSIRDDNPVFYLQTAGRGGDSGEVPEGEVLFPLGKAVIRRSGSNVTVVAVGGMLKPALRAADELAKQNIEVEVVDPLTLNPLDAETILESVKRTGRLVVVDEARTLCSAASEISATVAEFAFSALKAPIARVTVPNIALPFSPALEKELIPNADRIKRAITKVCGV